MKNLLLHSLLSTTLLLSPASPAFAAEPKAKPGPGDPSPSTRTFFIEGVKTAEDVKTVTAAAMKVQTVNKVEDLTPSSGYANISFDHHGVTHQQIAQGIADAGAYKVTFRFAVADYGKDDNAAKVDKVFDRVKELVRIEATDKAKGLFTIHFLPLKQDPSTPRGKGFNFGMLAHPIGDPAPKGLGLQIRQIAEGSLAAQAPGPRKAAPKKK
jgi:copper chaperone CopZ